MSRGKLNLTNYSADGANMVENGAKLLGMTNELLNTTGMRIQYLRERLNLTQKALAMRVDVGHVYINQLENDKRSAGRGLMQRLAHALGTSVGFLELETDDPSPPDADAPEPPVYYTEEADEAARLIDAMPEDKRREVLAVVRVMAAARPDRGGDSHRLGTTERPRPDAGQHLAAHPPAPVGRQSAGGVNRVAVMWSVYRTEFFQTAH